MGYIRETKLKKGNVRYQAEVRLKGHRSKNIAKIYARHVQAITSAEQLTDDSCTGISSDNFRGYTIA